MIKQISNWLINTLKRHFSYNATTNIGAQYPSIDFEEDYQASNLKISGKEKKRFENDVKAIIDYYTVMADRYRDNPAYSTGVGNVGADMFSGISCAKGCLKKIELINDYEINCLRLSRAIEESRDDFETYYHDSDGYGTGTLGQIGVDIEDLINKHGPFL